MEKRRQLSRTTRIAFLGSSCAAAAATLAAFLEESPAVGAMPASPGGPRGHGVAPRPTRSASSRPGNAGIAPTGKSSPTDFTERPEVVRVILAGAPGRASGEVEQLAAEAGILVVWVDSAAEATAALREVVPDVAVAACFPWRLPRAARVIPPLGILNVHPSLLPLGRGPEPVFWTLRRGERTTGATVHLMDAGLDTGPIVAQRELTLPFGVRAPELENALMALGGRLAIETLPALAAGALQPRAQQADATHAPVPSPADWTVMASLPAAWAWRFARGVAPLGGPLTVIAGGAAIRVSDAIDWSPDERLEQAVIDEGDGLLRVRFKPGWVRFFRYP